MPDYGMPHESQRGDESPFQMLKVLKTFVGTGMIVIGLIVALYVAISVFQIIKGDDPPAIINRFAEPATEEMVANAEASALQAFDLSPDVKQIVLYAMTFLFMVLPVAIATSLISAGAKLMHGDSVEALTQLAEKLKKSS